MSFKAGCAGVTCAVAVVVASTPPKAGAWVVRTVAPISTTTRPLLTGDVNGDGRPDVVAASDCAVSVFLGQGSGGFSPLAPLPVGTQPCGNRRPSIAMGDVNDDSHPDIVLTRSDNANVWVFTGAGDGTFAAPSTYATATGMGALDVAVGDLNNDGRDDVVVVETTGGLFTVEDLEVLVAQPTGGFAAPQRYGSSFMHAYGVAIGLMNDDANRDVVLGVDRCAPACTGGVLEFAGHGDGTIGVPMDDGPFTPTMLGAPLELFTAPLRGLARDDVIASQVAVRTLLPRADGTLSVAANADHGGYGAIADVDRDGALDLVTGQGERITVFLGDGAGDFGAEADYRFGSDIEGAGLADADGDGWPDLLLADGGYLRLLLNTPTALADPEAVDYGTFPVGSRSAARPVTIFNAGVRPVHVASADVSGAQATDFFVTLGPCAGAVLAAYDSCDVTTSFAPSAPGHAAPNSP